MDVKMIIVEAMETVIGAERDELLENLDLNLLENDLLDSLSIVTLLSEIEKAVGKKIDIKKISPESFLTINRMTAAIEAQL